MLKTFSLARLIVSIAISSLLIANSAQADSPSFTYVELDYVVGGDIEISDGALSADVDLDGFVLTGSVELGVLLLQASRFELESDTILGSNLEDSISTFAIGLTFELPRTAVYGLVRARRDEISINGTLGSVVDEELDETSVGLEAGVRFNASKRLELNASFGSPALDEGTSFGAGVQFKVTDNLGLNLKYNRFEVEDDGLSGEFSTASVGVRYSF